jgi:uncharacterized protein YdaU (DUF1376 family)
VSPLDKAPAYQWYVRDYMSDEAVALMSYEQQGIYRALLDRQWLEGSIPADPSQLAAILRVPVAKFQKLWPAVAVKFKPTEEGRLANGRMERERAKAEEYREAKARAGASGGKAKAQAQAKQNEAVLDSASSKIQANASSSSSSSTPSSSPKRESEMPAPVLSIRRGAGPMGSSYLSQSTQAVAALWTHPKGFTMGAGRYYSKLLANFDGNEPELHAWMNRKVDEHISAGGKVGDLFKFFDTALDTEFGAKVTARERAMNAEW